MARILVRRNTIGIEMEYVFRGKTALVTGSTTGIGYAIAHLLVREGAGVIVQGRSEERVQSAVTNLRAAVPEALLWGITCDFAAPESLVDLQLPDIGVDILVNNAGTYTSQPFADTPDSDWQRLFEVNVMSGVRLSRRLLPYMLERGWGRIIFISSECASLVPEDLIAYSATKAAVQAVSRGLAQLTRGTAVTVNTVSPGSTMSEGAEQFLTQQAELSGQTKAQVEANFFKEVRTTSLLGRFATTEEVAQAVLYLASPLSAATNGSVLRVDGGSVPGIS